MKTFQKYVVGVEESRLSSLFAGRRWQEVIVVLAIMSPVYVALVDPILAMLLLVLAAGPAFVCED